MAVLFPETGMLPVEQVRQLRLSLISDMSMVGTQSIFFYKLGNCIQ